MRQTLAAAVAALALPFAALVAQSGAPTQVISVQPLSAVFGVYSAEYERAAGQAVTWGVGATYWGDSFTGGDHATYTSAEFKVRGYPAGVALTGFSIGGAVGFASVSGKDYSNGTRQSVGGPSIGVLLEYQWLMGTSKEWAFALGAGAKALIIADKSTTFSYTAKYPTARISVGYAFK
jgi:hypothetical protein